MQGLPLWYSAVPDSARLLRHVAVHGVGSRGRDNAMRSTNWRYATLCAAIARVLNTDVALGADGQQLQAAHVPTPACHPDVVQATATATEAVRHFACLCVCASG